jgi:hypothetical protein
MRVIQKIFFVVMVSFFLGAMGSVSPCLGQSEEAIETVIDIHPETLNLDSKGKWITCYVEAPAGYSVEDIDPARTAISAIGGIKTDIESERSNIEDDKGVPVLMIKFSRSAVHQVMKDNSLQGNVEITVSGLLTDGTTMFEGSDTVKVKVPKK